MSTYFLLYLTDYSGIGVYAAALGSAVMIAARIFDVFNEPTVGMIINRSKVGRFGKYRPFILLSTLLSTFAVLALFFIPSGILKSKAIVIIYVFLFYFLYDIGIAFNVPELLYRSIAGDSNERGKLLVGPKFANVALGIFIAAIMSVVAVVSNFTGSYHTAFGITVAIYLLAALAITLLGLALVREYRHDDVKHEQGTKVTLKDFAVVFRENDAYRIKIISNLFSGFVWTLVFNACSYFAKWAYCADITTGEVDADAFALMMILSSLVTLVPMLTGVALSQPIMKKIGKPDKFYRILLLMQMIPAGLIFIFQMLGILQYSMYLFYGLLAVISFAMGASNVPASVINMEVMDYDIYKNHTDRSAIMNSISSLIGKIQSSISSVLLASVLIAIGYVVDSDTGNFIGDLANVPGMLNWFTVIMGLVPALFCLIAYLLLRRYPITDEMREKF